MIEELKIFWNNIRKHKKVRWIENIKRTYKNNEAEMYEHFMIEDIINTLKCTHKWQSSEIEKNKFLVHYRYSTHQLMMKLISEIIKEPEKMPD